MAESSCRACGAINLIEFLKLGDLPLSDGLVFPEDVDKPEPRFPLDVVFCPDCTLVQILETVSPDVLFSDDYPYFSSVSDALLDHSRRNVEARVNELDLGPESLVVELASNDGYLLQYYAEKGIPVLGIDPAKGPVDAALARGIPTLHRFFGSDVANELSSEGKRADVIHANNVLAHVADTGGFVAGIRTLLADDGVAVIEVPYVKELIDHCEFDTIYHEHLCYFSVTALANLFKRHGLGLHRVEPLTIHGGSLRLFVSHSRPADETVRAFLDQEAACGLTRIDYYRDFSARVAEVRAQLCDLVQGLKAEGKRLAAYGAAAKGAILLNYAGIDAKLLDWVADRNEHKQGRLMPGLRIPIVPPSKLLEDMPDYVLILPWNFKDEIMSQQAEYVARGGHFIVPIPEPVVI